MLLTSYPFLLAVSANVFSFLSLCLNLFPFLLHLSPQMCEHVLVVCSASSLPVSHRSIQWKRQRCHNGLAPWKTRQKNMALRCCTGDRFLHEMREMQLEGKRGKSAQTCMQGEDVVNSFSDPLLSQYQISDLSEHTLLICCSMFECTMCLFA